MLIDKHLPKSKLQVKRQKRRELLSLSSRSHSKRWASVVRARIARTAALATMEVNRAGREPVALNKKLKD
jgi:hypothetical protein